MIQDFDEVEFLECIKELIHVDRDWVPKIDNCSLYLRPTFIGTEVCKGSNKEGRKEGSL